MLISSTELLTQLVITETAMVRHLSDGCDFCSASRLCVTGQELAERAASLMLEARVIFDEQHARCESAGEAP